MYKIIIQSLEKKKTQHMSNINVILLTVRTTLKNKPLIYCWTDFSVFNGFAHHFANIICHWPQCSFNSCCLSFRSIIPAESIYQRRIFHSDTNSSLAVNNHILIKIILFLANLLPEARKHTQTRKPFILSCNHFLLTVTAIWRKSITY